MFVSEINNWRRSITAAEMFMARSPALAVMGILPAVLGSLVDNGLAAAKNNVSRPLIRVNTITKYTLLFYSTLDLAPLLIPVSRRSLSNHHI